MARGKWRRAAPASFRGSRGSRSPSATPRQMPALLMNELVTNALRHAFPDERRGHVAIAVGAPRPVVVADDGVGLGRRRALPRSFWALARRLLARPIGAELVFEDAAAGDASHRDADRAATPASGR